MHKKVTISLPPELNERWNEAVKKHSLVKSIMIQNYLLQILPMLEEKDPFQAINFIIKDNSKNLFDYDERAIYDKSVEDYKALKRG